MLEKILTDGRSAANEKHVFALPVSATAVLTLVFAFLFSAFFNGMEARAETVIQSVELNVGAEDAEDMQPGTVYTAFDPEMYDSSWEIYSYSTSSEHNTPKKAYYYTIELRPYDGYVFADQCPISVRGAYEIELLFHNQEKIRLKAKAYPYYIFPDVTGITRNGDTYTWDKVEYAGGYDVAIYYHDKEGDIKSSKKSVNTNRVDISNFETYNRTFDYISVRAKPGTGAYAGYFSNGKYVLEDGTPDAEFDDEEYSFRIPTSRLNGVSTTSSVDNANTAVPNVAGSVVTDGMTVNSGLPVSGISGGPGITGNNPVSNAGNWQQSGEDWYYVQNGTFLKGWVNPLNNDWYFMGPDGRMSVGWLYLSDYWYYFNPVHDGSYGRMLTGWQNVGGKWYCLNASNMGGIPYGAMYSGCVTPDGYTVGADGALLQ